MLYTFSSIVRLPEFDPNLVDAIRWGRPWINIGQEKISGTPTDRWIVTKSQHEFPSFDQWNKFYSEPCGTGKIEVQEIGIGILPASFTDLILKRRLARKIYGLTILESGGFARYHIQSGVYGIKDDEVRIILSSGINSWLDVSFESWKAFWYVANRYDKLLRAKRKLDQLRGTRENSGAFERLSAEIHEIISESLTEV